MQLTPRALPGALAATTCLLALAPAASADETVSQVFEAGSRITTGTAVSAADPVQLGFTVLRTGTVTIVKRTAPARPALAGGPEADNAAAPKYVGPRFEVRGDAVLGGAEFLIDDAAMPEAPANRERLSNAKVRCLQENTQGGTALQACGSGGETLKAGGTPGGDLRALWWKTQDEVSRGEEWDLSRHGNAGGGDLYVDLTRAGFQSQSFLQFRETYALDALLSKGVFPALILCTYRCAFTTKVTVSEAARRALGLKSRVIASGTIEPKAAADGRSSSNRLPSELPLKAGVAKVLKAKRVTFLKARQTGSSASPDGAVDKNLTNASIPMSSRAGTSGLTCRLRGVSGSELLVRAKKGVKRCPNVGKAPASAPAPSTAPAPSGGGRG